MTPELQMQLIIGGIKVAKALYPQFRQPLEDAVMNNDYELDDDLFKFVDAFMTGKVVLPDGVLAQLLAELYCPYLRTPILSYVESTNTELDNMAFNILDSILNCESSE